MKTCAVNSVRMTKLVARLPQRRWERQRGSSRNRDPGAISIVTCRHRFAHLPFFNWPCWVRRLNLDLEFKVSVARIFNGEVHADLFAAVHENLSIR